MHFHNKKQSQFELFPGEVDEHDEIRSSPYVLKDLTLSLENIIVLSIILIMVSVLFFSFGVEKGKGLTQGVDENNAAQEAVTVAEAIPAVIESTAEAPLEREMEPTPELPRTMEDLVEPLYTIQVASFKLEKNAQREADGLKHKGLESAFVLPKGSYSIVCVGKFQQRREAREFSRQLKGRYQDLLVRRF